MLTFSAGIVIGFCIKPAMRAYDNFDWYYNSHKHSFRVSLLLAFDDIWG